MIPICWWLYLKNKVIRVMMSSGDSSTAATYKTKPILKVTSKRPKHHNCKFLETRLGEIFISPASSKN